MTKTLKGKMIGSSKKLLFKKLHLLYQRLISQFLYVLEGYTSFCVFPFLVFKHKIHEIRKTKDKRQKTRQFADEVGVKEQSPREYKWLV